MLLGKRLRELRKEKGWTQEKLGDMVNVTKVSICCYESGTRIPTMDTFLSLIKVFNIDPNYLLGYDKYIVSDSKEDYGMHASVEEIALLKELRNFKDLHNKLVEEPNRVLNYLDKQIK